MCNFSVAHLNYSEILQRLSHSVAYLDLAVDRRHEIFVLLMSQESTVNHCIPSKILNEILIETLIFIGRFLERKKYKNDILENSTN